jgi:hypothetical protein
MPEQLRKLTTKQIADIEMVLVGWARVGVLVDLGVFSKKDQDIVFKTYSGSISWSWEKLQLYVAYYRHKTGVSDYWYHVEMLAQCARAWRKTHGFSMNEL